MSGSSVQVLKPKSQMDRRLARLEQMRVWDYVSQSVVDDVEAIAFLALLAEEAYGLSNLPDATDAFRLRAMQACADFLNKAHGIRKETFHDRTIPVLKNIEVNDALNAIPPPSDEIVVGQEVDPLIEHKKAVLAELRAAVKSRAIGIVKAVDDDA